MATLKVLLHEARDLPVMDRSTGLADTYVVLRLDSLEFTSPICTATRFPVWNSDYRFDTPDLLVLQEDPLEVRVYDHDILSRDPLVGFVNIDCNSFMYRPNPTISGWFPIFDTSTGLRGDIRLTLRIKFHAADNPLAPWVAERVVPSLPLSHSGDIVGRLRASLEGPGTFSESPSAGPPVTEVSASLEAASLKGGIALPAAVQAYISSDDTDLEPIAVQRSQQPTLAAEEEGVHIFSVSRLDPSVYRVEATHSMVEELIVKADPEHYRLTNLRSARNVNRARLVQLFKLSGKVRRQLAHKVIGLHCNAVLGYVEEFDMEPHGIIVRAYGTPCIVSSVKNFDLQVLLADAVPTHGNGAKKQHRSFTLPPSDGHPEGANSPEGDVGGLTSYGAVNSPAVSQSTVDDGSPTATTASAEHKLENVKDRHRKKPVKDPWQHASTPPVSPSLQPMGAAGINEKVKHSLEIPDAVVSGSRANIIILSVKELPSGCIQHIGGYICARSVKIISKNKSKPIISQERDVWWMELREELRANARAFHCNAILGYEEVSQYQDDVALLTLSGTAVMINPSMTPLRGGPELLFRTACNRFDARKQCSLLHLYNTSHRHTPGETAWWSPHSTCQVCHERSVPNFLLGSCSIPVDLQLAAPPQLIEVHVAQAKKDVKNVDLAKVASQALPFIEFALHKQLLFRLRLQQFNSCFGIHVSIVLGPDAIVGTLTGTGCRVVGLPVPLLPRLDIIDPLIAKLEPVRQLGDIVKRSRRRGRRGSSSSHSSSSSSSPDKSSNCSPGSSGSTSSWVRTDDSSSEIYHPPEQLRTGGTTLTDVIVKIDDEEEADMMLGMVSLTKAFQDDILITVPYVPDSANAYLFHNQIVLIRRYTFGKTGCVGDNNINRLFNNCCANAKEAFCQRVCRIAMRSPDVQRVHVVNFRIVIQFEQNSHDMHMRLEGVIVGVNGKSQDHLSHLEQKAFHHCAKLLSWNPVSQMRSAEQQQEVEAIAGEPVPTCSMREVSVRDAPGNNEREGGTSTPSPASVKYRGLFDLFIRSTAPFSLPYVFRNDIPMLKPWFPQMAPDSVEQEVNDMPERPTTYDSYRVRQIKGAKSVRRQMESLMSNIKTSFSRVVGKTRGVSAGKTMVDGEVNSVDAGNSHCPILRLPDDIESLHDRLTVVQTSSTDYIPGFHIVRYLGRLSQHYIREDSNIFTPEDLGGFYQSAEREVYAMVQSLVITQGGNALLKYSVVFHEIEDSDGSGNASVLITVTGDVAQVTDRLAPESTGAPNRMRSAPHASSCVFVITYLYFVSSFFVQSKLNGTRFFSAFDCINRAKRVVYRLRFSTLNSPYHAFSFTACRIAGIPSSVAAARNFSSVDCNGSTDSNANDKGKGTQSHSSSARFSNKSSREQFESQRQAYHQHSFHEKGEGNPFGSSINNKQAGSSCTGEERRSIAAKWENAFFGRVHYEDGMHARYAEAVAADEQRESGLDLEFGEAFSIKDLERRFPSWTEDMPSPRHLFHLLSAKNKLSFILDRLAKGERRIQFAPDYGSLSMMSQLHLGEMMLKDAESLLLELGWMTPELQDQILALKKAAARIKYDYDID
eukprot:gene4291-3107_t